MIVHWASHEIEKKKLNWTSVNGFTKKKCFFLLFLELMNFYYPDFLPKCHHQQTNFRKVRRTGSTFLEMIVESIQNIVFVSSKRIKTSKICLPSTVLPNTLFCRTFVLFIPIVTDKVTRLNWQNRNFEKQRNYLLQPSQKWVERNVKLFTET